MDITQNAPSLNLVPFTLTLLALLALVEINRRALIRHRFRWNAEDVATIIILLWVVALMWPTMR